MILYVLRNENSKYYIGITSNILNRIKDHNRGKTKATAKYAGSWKIYHIWILPNYIVASKLERCLHKLTKAQILRLIILHPKYDGFLLNIAKLFPTTEYELKKGLEEGNLEGL